MPFKKIIFEVLFLVWMAIVPFISSIGLGYFATTHIDFFRDFSIGEQSLFWAFSTFMMGFAFCPTTFFALFVGYLWGFNSLMPFVISYSIASIIGYGLGKLIHGDDIVAFLAQKFKMKDFLTTVQKDSFAWVFLTRLSPIFPFAITNAMMAFLGVNFRNFWIAGTLGMLPRTLLALWTGHEAQNYQMLMNSPEGMRWQDFISLGLLLLSAGGMIWKSRIKK